MSSSATAQPFDPLGPGGRFSRSARKLSVAEALNSATETQGLYLGPNLIHRVPELVRKHFPGCRVAIVTDETAWGVAGNRVAALCEDSGLSATEPYVFRDPQLYAEHSFVESLVDHFRRFDAVPVAVGSGTINDLVKLASHRVGRSYLCVATAASMDGYTAFGASITFNGAKQTFNCPAPRAVIADLDIVCGAPAAMTASGYADLQAKITSGADWILADALGIEPIDPRAWEIVQGGLSDALANPAGARAGRPDAIAPLIEGLMLGGFAMQWMKSSRPASGAEHQFSHLWDMEHHVHLGSAPAHGFKVGIATLAVTALYEELIKQPIDQLDVAACCAQWPEPAEMADRIRELFGASDFLSTAIDETNAKHPTRAVLQIELQRLRDCWPALREALRAQLVPYAELKRRLQLVGAPSEPEEIGISRERLRASFFRAYHIRRRFTVLDLVVRAGLLDRLLDRIFGEAGIWRISS